MSPKRICIATLSGVLFGFVCYAFAASGPQAPAWPIALQIIFSRTLMGFAIGISVLKLGHWAIHGLVMGLVFSLPLAFSSMMAPASTQYTRASMFVWSVVLGMVYGLLIEVITSALFKAKRPAPVQP